MCVHACAHEYPGTHEIQKPLDSLDLELWEVVSHPVWALGIELWSSSGTVGVLKHWDISPVSATVFDTNSMSPWLVWNLLCRSRFPQMFNKRFLPLCSGSAGIMGMLHDSQPLSYSGTLSAARIRSLSSEGLASLHFQTFRDSEIF